MRREVQIARFWLNSCRVSQSLGSCAALRSEALVTRMAMRKQMLRTEWVFKSFSLSMSPWVPNSICRANADTVYGLKHQHFTLHSITLFVLNTSATWPYVANITFLVSTFQYCYHVRWTMYLWESLSKDNDNHKDDTTKQYYYLIGWMRKNNPAVHVAPTLA